MAPASSKTVCVMDASGHLGSTLVQRLLQKGYTVHAASQNHDELQSLEGVCSDTKKLRVFHSDPLDYHSITDALKGCCGLFYSFDPPSDHRTYDEFMADVEVRAAHNILEACAQTETIRKVVFTSSITAVIWRDGRNPMPSVDLDERNWSDVNFCRKFKLWHALAKTLAEKTAWALAMDRGVNMVSINGGLLMSPDLTIKNPYLKGAAEMYEDGVFVTLDLRFAVDAYMCVFEDISSYGRYICFNHSINYNEDALKLAQMLVPPSASSPPHESCFEDTRVYQQRICNQKLNKLMVGFDS
ncbi:hypothetical protein L1049_001959 [Liquidambar formosana]|uniref:NAD(P)-binding domain-containing protein n=1 Tax=Liquidambar formosana TaxID=63359 RepID=A0AAP0NGE5_LIQFO